MTRTASFVALTAAFILTRAGCTAASGPQAAETTALLNDPLRGPTYDLPVVLTVC